MKPDLIVILLAALLAAAGWPDCVGAGTEKSPILGDDFRIRGYVQGNPLHIRGLPEPFDDDTFTEYRLHKRLNLRWDATQDFSFHWQMRTRLFAGDLVKDFPAYVQDITRDDGLVDLSWTLIEEDDWIVHYIPDRLYTEWNRGDWNVRAGRQRVNWGVNMITNPNDIFNIYSIYDFDYPERPGSDAVRIQRFLGFGTRFEVAASPDRDLENSVAAALFAFDARGYDVQLIGGYYRERLAAGGGWAGNLNGAGLKGETMFFADFKKENRRRDTNFITAASIDYMFANGLFAIAEVLFNQGGGRDAFSWMAAETLSPDNPSFSRYQAALQLTYPIHPLVDGTLTTIGYPDEDAVFISPALTWSVIADLDAQILGQFFAAGNDSALDGAGNLVTASLKYHF